MPCMQRLSLVIDLAISVSAIINLKGSSKESWIDIWSKIFASLRLLDCDNALNLKGRKNVGKARGSTAYSEPG